jgi:hypothetical protein
MKESMMLDIPKALDEISDAVMTSLSYKPYPLHKLEMTIQSIDAIVSNPSNLKQCEECLKSTGTNYVLFFLSNIIYNLKRQGELVLTDEIIKWLGSVWKNFLKRNKLYQEIFPAVDEYRIKLGKYYPLGASFISQIENVNLIMDDFIDDAASDDSALKRLEKFHQSASEILSAMKPTYFFLLDYYYEKKINTGADSSEAVTFEVGGLNKFGQPNYTYRDIMILICQALGILEAAYLHLKKKKSQRRLINVNGKQKFLTASEIYTVYLERFNAMKKELVNLNK